MASDLTLIEGVAVATLVFTILAVLFVSPYLLVAFGFFPDSGFARRVHPPNAAVLEQLQNQNDGIAAIRDDIAAIRQFIETHTNAATNDGGNLN